MSDRFVSITDCLNFRHLGGYPTTEGRITRGDLLFRSGWFELSSAEDVRTFESLSIGKVFDFRSEPERERRPLQLAVANPPERVELGITSGSMGPYLQQIPGLDPSDVDCRREMIRMHSALLDEALPKYRELFVALLETTDPVLLLCSTGKDRTGVAAALILTVLGVPWETVLEDYLWSAHAYRGRELLFAKNHGLDRLGVDLELVRDVFTVHPEYLDAVWEDAQRIGGSMANFFEQHLHLSAGDVARLRELFTALQD
jgi:protein-tyrosine phosphatase